MRELILENIKKLEEVRDDAVNLSVMAPYNSEFKARAQKICSKLNVLLDNEKALLNTLSGC
jgi:hypothetical protein